MHVNKFNNENLLVYILSIAIMLIVIVASPILFVMTGGPTFILLFMIGLFVLNYSYMEVVRAGALYKLGMIKGNPISSHIASMILAVCNPSAYAQLSNAHVMEVHIKHYHILVNSDYYVLPCYKNILENFRDVAKAQMMLYYLYQDSGIIDEHCYLPIAFNNKILATEFKLEYS